MSYNLNTVVHPRMDYETSIDPSLSTELDLAFNEGIDPSLSDKFYLFFEKEIPLELRTYDGSNYPTEAGNVEDLKVKILLSGDPKYPEEIRVEISSENNLFFSYIHQTTHEEFSDIQDSQKLLSEFHEYPSLLARLFTACLKEPLNCTGVISFSRDKKARLDFIQNMDHKFVELLQVLFNQSSEDFIRRQITFRYNAIKSKAELLQTKLQDFNKLVKLKNPSLMIQMKSHEKLNFAPKKYIS